MGMVISIDDAGGPREHYFKDALRVKWTGKIGTVVVIDIAVTEIPTDQEVVATMGTQAVLLQTFIGGWTVSNADGESYSNHVTVFFLSQRNGELYIHLKQGLMGGGSGPLKGGGSLAGR